jgi:hypothetical protein
MVRLRPPLEPALSLSADMRCLAHRLRSHPSHRSMAGALPPRLSLGRHLAATVGFLAFTGAQRLSGSPQQRRALEMAEVLLQSGEAQASKGGDGHEDELYAAGSAFLCHGCK